jgi:hypothetical protein
MNVVKKYGCLGISVIIGLMLVGTTLGLIGSALGWFSAWAKEPARILSPENVKAQWAFAYGYEESLKTAARNVCGVREALIDPKIDNDEAKTRRRELTTLTQNYNRILAQYNAKLRNMFEAKIVKPPDVIVLAYSLEDQITVLQRTEQLACGLSK